MTTLDPATITAEAIVAAAAARGLRLMNGGFLVVHYGTDGWHPVGCCPITAIALEGDATLLERRSGFMETFQARGLSFDFGDGLATGFDEEDASLEGHSKAGIPDFARGFALGRATRRLAGLDAAATEATR